MGNANRRVAARIARACAATWLSALTAVACSAEPSTDRVGHDRLTVTKRFAPAADSRVELANPSTNYGSSTTLSSDGDPLRRAYLRFAVSALGGAVVSAKLRCYAEDGTSGGPAAHRTTSAWGEATITWNNAPAPGAMPTDAGGRSIGTGTWAEWDVTSAITGDGTYDFVLVPTSTDALHCSSREASTTSNRPELVIVVSSPDDGGAIVTDGGAATDSGGGATMPVTVTFRDGVSPSAGYAGTSDTYLMESGPTGTHGTSASLYADGDDPAGSGQDVETLVRFDVSSIPPGSPITSASLTFTVTNTSTGDYPVYALLRAWNEAQATWTSASSGVAWQASGAKGSADRGTTALATVSPRATGTLTVPLSSAGLALVQSWVDNPSANFGVIVASSTVTDGLAFASSDNGTASNRPALTVTYGGSSMDGGTSIDGGSGSGCTGFFPKGMYGWDEPGPRWDTFQSLGFNAVNVGPYRDHLDNLVARGMKGVVWLGDYSDTTCTFDYSDAWIRTNVGAIAGHAGILAYQISDEPEQAIERCPNVVTDLRARAALVRSIDPTKPTYQVVSNAAYSPTHTILMYPYETFAGVTDIMGLDIYPCRWDSPTCHFDEIDEAIRQANGDGVTRYWAVVQDFEDATWRYPTPDEIRTQLDRWVPSRMEGYFVFSWDWYGNTLDGRAGDQAALAEKNATICGGTGGGGVDAGIDAGAATSDAGTSTTLRFAVIGDFGNDSSGELGVSTLVRGWSPDLVITVGDNNYPDGAASTIDANIGKYYHDFIAPYSGAYGAGASTNRFFPSLGNHDWHAAGALPYLAYFALPGNERYYDFTSGPVHFFAIDSDGSEPDGTSSSSVQATWLRTRLAASSSPWNIVYFHHSPYCSGSSHGSTSSMQWPFATWGADVVLSGHDHVYERVLRDGIVYFVDGLGGAGISGFSSTIVSGSQIRYNADYGALRVTATPTSMRFDFVSRTGLSIDTYSLP